MTDGREWKIGLKLESHVLSRSNSISVVIAFIADTTLSLADPPTTHAQFSTTHPHNMNAGDSSGEAVNKR